MPDISNDVAEPPRESQAKFDQAWESSGPFANSGATVLSDAGNPKHGERPTYAQPSDTTKGLLPAYDHIEDFDRPDPGYGGGIWQTSVGNERLLSISPTLERSAPPPLVITADDIEALYISDFPAKATTLFAKIDTDSDGWLSDTELGEAMQSNIYTGENAQVVAALTKNSHDLEELSNDDFGYERYGITKDDLNQFAELQERFITEWSAIRSVSRWLIKENNFDRIDSDKDGYLSSKELRSVLRTAENEKPILYLFNNLSTIEKGSNDEGDQGITKEDIKKHETAMWSETEHAKISQKVLDVLVRTAESQTKEISTSLYANAKNPIESITPNVPRQGKVGDCVFISALSSVAATDPDSIRKMIKTNSDGTYTVTFPGAPKEPITVSAPTAQEMGLYNGGSKDGTWACVLEKAYGTYCGKHFWRRAPFQSSGSTPQQALDGGSSTDSGLRLLTGRGTDRDELAITWDSTTARKLQEALSAESPRAVTCGINNALFYGNTTSDGWRMGHTHSVLKFEPDGNGGGMVTVRNPWGGEDGTTSGTKRISLNEFTRNFSTVTYSTAP